MFQVGLSLPHPVLHAIDYYCPPTAPLITIAAVTRTATATNSATISGGIGRVVTIAPRHRIGGVAIQVQSVDAGSQTSIGCRRLRASLALSTIRF